jgi:riboflavin transporter
MKTNTRLLTRAGVLSALATVLAIFVHFPLLAHVNYLLFDLGDVALLLGGFALGPAAGLAITTITCILMAVVTGQGGPIGAVMHFLASGSLVFVSALVYKYIHSRRGALVGLALGTVAMTAVMLGAWLLLVPSFWGMTLIQVKALLIPVVIPFNLLKGVINAVLTLAVYMRLRFLLKG